MVIDLIYKPIFLHKEMKQEIIYQFEWSWDWNNKVQFLQFRLSDMYFLKAAVTFEAFADECSTCS